MLCKKWRMNKTVPALLAFFAGTLSQSAVATASVSETDSVSRSDELRSLNIQADPLLLIIKGLNVGVQYGVSPRFTIGPNIGYFLSGWSKRVSDGALAADLQANLWLTSDRFKQGLFVRSYLGWTDAATVYYERPSTGEITRASKLGVTDAAALLGYHFPGNAGFNFEVAAGVGYYFWGKFDVPAGLVVEDTKRSLGPRLQARVGWSF
jgi:hypothetical protein